MTDQIRFSPATVTIHVGEAVRWRNTSSGITHPLPRWIRPRRRMRRNVALPAGAQTFDSGSVSPGTTFEHTFTVAGTYRYFCKPHETFGMLGTVTVLP